MTRIPTVGDFIAQGFFVPLLLFRRWVVLVGRELSISDPRVIQSVN